MMLVFWMIQHRKGFELEKAIKNTEPERTNSGTWSATVLHKTGHCGYFLRFIDYRLVFCRGVHS